MKGEEVGMKVGSPRRKKVLAKAYGVTRERPVLFFSSVSFAKLGMGKNAQVAEPLQSDINLI